MRSPRPFRPRDDILSLPAQPAEEIHALFKSVTHILRETFQSSGTTPGRTHCAPNGADGISLPWQQR